MASPEHSDPYLDPTTGVLRNKVGALTRADLASAEGALAFARAVELADTPVPATGDLNEFRAIHRHLFQDVYDWAGELRTINMRKLTPGAELFMPEHLIDRAASVAAGELRNDRMLRGLDRPKFIERLSYHYDQWNHLHPFRDGNGRTQRLFWDRIATDAGWRLDWRTVRGEVNNEACRIASEQRDFAPLHQMFHSIVARRDEGGQDDTERLGIRPPGIDPGEAARLARMDTPLPPRAVPAQPQQHPSAAPQTRGASRRSPDAGLGR